MIPRWCLQILIAAGFAALLLQLIRRLRQKEFGADFLAGAAVLTAYILGEYGAGIIILLMFFGGALLERIATARASSVLNALAKRMPSKAHRKNASGWLDINVKDIAVGDILIVLPHEIAPVDAIVLEGHGSMDESFLTGEPYHMSKAPGSNVLSGSINGGRPLVIRAIKRPDESRYARIMDVVKESEKNPPRIRRLADRLATLYTPLAFAASVAAWFLSGSPDRFLAVLVVATPCPMILAIPIAVIGSISLCAKRGIVIKKPAALEEARDCRTIIFDKTGTLTYGRPRVADVKVMPGHDVNPFMALVASLEKFSRHPLARAVLDFAEEHQLPIEEPTNVQESPGQGLSGDVNGRQVQLVGRKNFLATHPSAAPLPVEGEGLESVVSIDGVCAGIIYFVDEPRPEGKSFIAHLGPKHEIQRQVILSGDRVSEAKRLAAKVGISEVHGGKTPEEKLQMVRESEREAKTIFVGDGINDAPALGAARIGIAMGTNSDITSEAASVVILDNSLSKIDEFFHISNRMRRIAMQSAVGGMTLSAVGMILAAAGYLTAIEGAVFQELIDLLAIGNALRAAVLPKTLSDF